MRTTVRILTLLLTTATARGALFVEVPLVSSFREVEPMDIYLREEVIEEVQRLNRFQVMLRLGNATPDGIRFELPAVTPTMDRAPVFPGVELRDLGSTYNTIFVSAALPPGGEVDVTNTVNGLFTAFLRIPQGFPIDRPYVVAVDGANTFFYDVNGALMPVAAGAGGGIIPIPEPATGIAALATLGLLALRRRRQSVRSRGSVVNCLPNSARAIHGRHHGDVGNRPVR